MRIRREANNVKQRGTRKTIRVILVDWMLSVGESVSMAN